MSTIDLKGQAAVITGGACGIGFISAQRLARAGANIVLSDVDPATLAEASAVLSG